MTKREKMWLGGGALVALAAGGVYLATKKPATPAAPVNPLPGQVTTLNQGQQYTITAMLPAGITDATTLAASLKAAGWTGISVWAVVPAGAAPAANPNFAAPVGGYVAQGTWGNASAPVPAGVVAVPGVQTGTFVPLATA